MPIYSKYPPIQLSQQDIYSFLFNRANRTYPDSQIIFRDASTDKFITYSQIKTVAEEFSQFLVHNLDWKKGDVLVTVSANAIEIPPITLGALRAGGIVSPANPAYTPTELAYQLKDSGAKAVVTTTIALQCVKDACQEVGIPERNIVLLDKENWKSLLVSESLSYKPPVNNPETDLAFLVYSSGTTGRSKGVGEQGNVTWNGAKTSPGIPKPNGKGDVLLSSLPFFHIYGLTVLVLNPIYTGATSIVMSKFNIDTFCQMIQKHQVTYAYIVPPIVLLLNKHPSVLNYNLSSIRMMNSGAAPLTEELVLAVYRRIGVRVKQGYGLSETSPAAFFQRWEDWRTTVGSSGWMMPNMQAKFCTIPRVEAESERSRELAEGETGELYLKGPNIFLGYHHNEVETRDSLSADGWFRTGDIGYLDKHGNLFITDRLKELIKYKGYQVPPAELEGYMIDHPLVSDVAVIGFDSKFLGTECPRAYVVPASGMAKASKEQSLSIISWLNGKVAHHKKLRGGLEFVDSIPKSASGKILRRVLKARAKENSQAIEKEIEENGKMKARL